MLDTSITLLERLRQPENEHAWQRFVELYTPLLCAWARRLGLHEPDAADLVQDVFVRLVEKLPLFVYNRDKHFRGWLHAVLVNRWRELRRRPAPANSAPLPEPAGPDPTEEFAEEEYRQHLVAQALRLMRAEFSEATWKACWEFVVVGRPAAEIATELGLTVGSVYAAKCRVLSRLRVELAGLLE